jgi:hypothetical protein
MQTEFKLRLDVMTCSFIDSTIISYKIVASIFRVYSPYSKKKAAVTKTSTVAVLEVGDRLSCSNTDCVEFSAAVVRELDTKKAVSAVTGLEWPRVFQEVKVPRFHDNGTGWW